MSHTLLNFAKSFLSGRLTASVFSEAYIELWRIERDNDLLLHDAPALSECLSSIFCAADMYYPAEFREEHEFDEDQLRAEVARWVQKARGLE
ncbi:colicin immunity protein [Streptomyces cavourensis]|nr:colicin immunity protein [Streptomyces cavourensis]